MHSARRGFGCDAGRWSRRVMSNRGVCSRPLLAAQRFGISWWAVHQITCVPTNNETTADHLTASYRPRKSQQTRGSTALRTFGIVDDLRPKDRGRSLLGVALGNSRAASVRTPRHGNQRKDPADTLSVSQAPLFEHPGRAKIGYPSCALPSRPPASCRRRRFPAKWQVIEKPVALTRIAGWCRESCHFAPSPVDAFFNPCSACAIFRIHSRAGPVNTNWAVAGQ